MKVFVAGATGAIGWPLVRRLAAAQHEVVGLARDERGVARLRDRGVREVVVADALDRQALLAAVRGHRADAVIHQLTALKKAPAAHRHMAATDALREQGSDNLLDAARELGASRFVTQSIVLGYGYRDHGGAVLTETTPFGVPDGRRGFDAHVAAMKAAEDKAFLADGIEGIALRYGLFYGQDAAAVATMLRKRALPVARQGGALPFVHHDDAAAATVAALEQGRDGEAYNIVDDTPLTFRQLVEAVARAEDAPEPLRLPGGLLRLVAPYGGVVMTEVAMQVSNAKARRELGWEPQYPSARDGLRVR
jgi:nucleoside-diphosphate-sugar epimerase